MSPVADFVDADLEQNRRMIARYFNRLSAVTDDLKVCGKIVVVVLFPLLIDRSRIALAEGVARLSPDRFNVDILSLRPAGVDEALRSLDDIRVEGTCETFVASDNDHENVLLFAFD